MRPTIYVLRHGQTEWNRDGLMQGHGNSPLTALGRDQAARQGEILARMELPAGIQAWSSPSGRAVETAGIAVAPHVALVRTDDRLREIGVGAAEGTRGTAFAEARARRGVAGWIEALDAAEGGEGFAAFEARVAAFLDALSGPAILVCHGGTRLVCRAHYAGRDVRDLPEGGTSQGSVLRLDGEGERWFD